MNWFFESIVQLLAIYKIFINLIFSIIAKLFSSKFGNRVSELQWHFPYFYSPICFKAMVIISDKNLLSSIFFNICYINRSAYIEI